MNPDLGPYCLQYRLPKNSPDWLEKGIPSIAFDEVCKRHTV